MNIYSYSNPPLGFYVYAYIRANDSIIAPAGTPYYIGKGKGNRAWAVHHRGTKGIRRPTNSTLIVILESNLTDVGAFALERRYIRWYGRKDKSSGILRNLTDGGEGGSGSTGPKTPWPEERKRRVSEKLKGRKHPRTKEQQQKLNNALAGRGPNSAISYDKFRTTMAKKYQDGYINPAAKRIKITNKETGEVIITYGIKTWAEENKFNANTVDWSYRKHGFYKHYLIELDA